jgi:trypsin
LTQNGVLIGVISFGQGCARSGHFGIYAKVSSVRDWIKEVTGI